MGTRGRPPLDPDDRKSERFWVFVEPWVRRALERIAAAEGTSLSVVVHRVLVRWLVRTGHGPDDENEI